MDLSINGCITEIYFKFNGIPEITNSRKNPTADILKFNKLFWIGGKTNNIPFIIIKIKIAWEIYNKIALKGKSLIILTFIYFATKTKAIITFSIESETDKIANATGELNKITTVYPKPQAPNAINICKFE